MRNYERGLPDTSEELQALLPDAMIEQVGNRGELVIYTDWTLIDCDVAGESLEEETFGLPSFTLLEKL